MKTWKPDTCDCLVEEIYEGTNIVGGGQVLRKCSVHQAVPDVNLYGILYSNPDGENKRKNLLRRALLGFEGFSLNLEETKTNPDGSTYLEFKNGITVTFTWTGEGDSRVLQLQITGVNLTTNQRNLVRNFCDTRFGVGRVVLL